MKLTLSYDIAIIKKVHELFEYRKIPIMLDVFDCGKNDFLNRLYHLQYLIFELDQYLEQNWKLDNQILSEKWMSVEDDLSTFNAEKAIKKLMSQLRIYESHEMNLRNGDRPENVNIRYFYYYKSCDVKLMRNLILDKARKSNIHLNFKASDWLVFDWVTEVNDDVEDLEEDKSTNNCNRLLYALEMKGADAIIEYMKFLEYLKIKARTLRALSSSKIKNDIYRFTLVEIENTKNMLLAFDTKTLIK